MLHFMFEGEKKRMNGWMSDGQTVAALYAAASDSSSQSIYFTSKEKGRNILCTGNRSVQFKKEDPFPILTD